MANKHLPLFLTIIVAFCFIFPAAFVKILMDTMSPVGTLTIRFFIASIGFPLLIAIIHREKIKSILYPKSNELEQFALLALFLFLNMAVGFTSYYFIPANKALLIFLMYPIFDSILAWIFLKEPITKTDYAAIGLTVLGAYFILGLNGDGQESLIGYGMMFISTIMFAAYLVKSRAVAKKFDYYKRTAWLFIFCFFYFLIIFSFTGEITIVFQLTGFQWLILAAFGIVSTLVPYICLSYVTGKVKSSTTSIIIAIGPVLGIWLVTYLFNEPFTRNMWIGGSCIVLAFMISAIVEWQEEEKTGKKKHMKHAHS
jgi:drug/metabolite transporter (DMT)-like permease